MAVPFARIEKQRHDPYAPGMAEKYGMPGKTDNEGQACHVCFSISGLCRCCQFGLGQKHTLVGTLLEMTTVPLSEAVQCSLE